MVVTFIVIANEVLKCYISQNIGVRFCEPGSSLEITRLWQLGLVEIAFEGVLGGAAIKIWRRLTDRLHIGEDRFDKRLDPKELGK